MAFFTTLGAIGAAAGIGTAATATAGASIGAILAGGAIAGTALHGFKSLLMGGSQPSAPQQAQNTGPSADDLIAQSNAKAQADSQDLLAQRRRNTVLTGPRGLFDEAGTAKKTLLGG